MSVIVIRERTGGPVVPRIRTRVIEVGRMGRQGPPGTLIEVAEDGTVITSPLRTLDFSAGFDVVETEPRRARVELDLAESDDFLALDNRVTAHEDDAINAHEASAVHFTPTADITSENVQDAIVEVAQDVADAIAGSHPNLAAHDALGLATQAELDAEAAARAAADTAHAADTTNIHGITDTSLLADHAYVASAVATAIADLIDAAPGALDTLNELAAALGDDPNFATTITNALALKLNISAHDLLLHTGLGIETTAGAQAKVDVESAARAAADALLIPKALIDAPGDLIVGTADNTPAKLTAGADFDVLIRRATEPGGMKWRGQDVVDCRDFDGLDGTANEAAAEDNYVAITAALAEAKSPVAGDAVSRPCYLHTGDYRVSQQVQVPSRVLLKGAGSRNTVIQAAAGFVGLNDSGDFHPDMATLRLGQPNVNPVFGCRAEEITIKGGNLVGSAGVYTNAAQEQSGIRKCTVSRWWKYGYLAETTRNGDQAQRITLASLDGGDSFKLTFGGQETTAFVVGTNCTAVAIKAGLEALSSIAPNTVTVTGTTDAGPFDVTFDNGTLDGTNPDYVAVTSTSGCTGTVSIFRVAATAVGRVANVTLFDDVEIVGQGGSGPGFAENSIAMYLRRNPSDTGATLNNIALHAATINVNCDRGLVLDACHAVIGTRLHFENQTDCAIDVGDGLGASGVHLTGLTGHSNITGGIFVRIDDPLSYNYSVAGLFKGAFGGTTLTVDDVNEGISLSGDVGFYAVGNGTVGQRQRLSDRPEVGIAFGTPSGTAFPGARRIDLVNGLEWLFDGTDWRGVEFS